MQRLLCLLALLALVCAKTEFKEENNVAVLTKSIFDAVVDDYEYVLVEFYAPWCGHCKALKPEYEKAAEILKTELPNVLLAMVDATVESDLATTHGVSGYPTLKFRKNKKWIDFSGDRKAEAIVAWIKRKIQPTVQIVNTAAEMETFLKSNEVVVVGFMKDAESPSRTIFEEAADSLDKYPFALVTSQELLSQYDVKQDVLIRLFKTFDDGHADFEGELAVSAITDFVTKESIPLVVEFSQESAGNVFGSPIRMHVVAFIAKSGDYENMKNGMATVAKAFKGKAHFIVIDTDVEDHRRILDFFGMSESDVPAYRMISLAEDMVKYKPDSSDFSESIMSAFVKSVLDGTRKPFLMSQEVPADSDEPVRVLVGTNYNEVTSDESKAVFVELYAPWCGHCKQLAPIWTELGEAYKDREDLIIAKMDATANEAENLRVHSFPTLKFYPKGSKEAVDYNGERTLEALKKFVESEGKIGAAEKSEEETKDEL